MEKHLKDLSSKENCERVFLELWNQRNLSLHNELDTAGTRNSSRFNSHARTRNRLQKLFGSIRGQYIIIALVSLKVVSVFADILLASSLYYSYYHDYYNHYYYYIRHSPHYNYAQSQQQDRLQDWSLGLRAGFNDMGNGLSMLFVFELVLAMWAFGLSLVFPFPRPPHPNVPLLLEGLCYRES